MFMKVIHFELTHSGVFTLSLTNPIWVVKTRMCLQTSPSANEIYYSGIIGRILIILHLLAKWFFCRQFWRAQTIKKTR